MREWKAGKRLGFTLIELKREHRAFEHKIRAK